MSPKFVIIKITLICVSWVQSYYFFYYESNFLRSLKSNTYVFHIFYIIFYLINDLRIS